MTKPIDEVNNEFVPEEHKEQPMSITTNGNGTGTANSDEIRIRAEFSSEEVEDKSKKEKSDDDNSEQDKSIHHPTSFVPWPITSFAELATFEEARERSFEISEKAQLIPDMIANIMASEEIKDKDKQKAIRKVGDEFADMVKNIHEDDDKKEIADKSNIEVNVNITKDSTETKELVKDLSLIARLKDRVVDVFRKEEEPIEIPSSKLSIWKDKDGTYRFLAVYSNNYRDEDIPVPEIISGKSHLNFVEKVRSGDFSYPVLRHYHVPGTDWGQTNFVDYNEESGFALAAGYILPGKEKEAQLIMDMEDIALSHGMKNVKKDELDNSIIVQHQTFEISVLPRSVAANQMTGFYLDKEKNMTLSPEIRDHLGKVGWGTEKLDALEKDLDKSQKDAEAEGIERKEASADDSDNRKSDGDEKSDAQPAFSEAQSVELKAVFETLVKSQNEQFIALLTPIAESIKNLEEAEGSETERLQKIVEQSPPATLEAFLFAGDSWKSQSATENLETIIEGGKRTKEGKDGPKETKEKDEERIVNTGDAFTDDLIHGILSKKPEEFEGIG